MDNLLAFWLIDDLLPRKGGSGNKGNGCGCLIMALILSILYVIVSSVCSLIYTSCSSATQHYKERKTNQQEIQRLKDYNDALTTIYFREFSEKVLEAEGFVDLDIHDVYVARKDSIPKDTGKEGEDWVWYYITHHLEGDFHMEGDTAHFYFELRMDYDYKQDVDCELQPICNSLQVMRAEDYRKPIYGYSKNGVSFAVEPYDSICRSHTALWHHLDSLARDLLPIRIGMKVKEFERLERPLRGLERCLRAAGYEDGQVDTIRGRKGIEGLRMLLKKPNRENKEEADRAFRHARGMLTGLGENRCPYSEKCGIWKVGSKTIYLAKTEKGIMVTISKSDKVISPWVEQSALP